MKLPARSVDQFVTIDFETYYSTEYTLSKLTTAHYVWDERFEVIGVGVKVNGGPAVWMGEFEFRAWAMKQDWSRTAVLAHNTTFDGFILAHHYKVKPAIWFDTLSMARAVHGAEVGGSLAKLATHYGIGEKGHEVILAKGKRRRDFTEEGWFQYGEYCKNDTELCWKLFQIMSAGYPESELWLIDLTLRMFTEPTLVLDEPLLEKFLIDERARKAKLLARVAQDRSVLLSNDKFAALLIEYGEEPTRKISPRTDKEIWAFAKTDPGMQTLLEHERDEVRWLAEARVDVKSTINETRAERFLNLGRNGRAVPVGLRYYGAHTGRWSGGERTNFQNLVRGGELRQALCAPEGKELVVADSTAIEARKTAWLAGHDELVSGFAKDRDVYSEFASEVYRREVDRKKHKERDFIPGFVGKTSILGLGYGMGWLKFAATLLKGPPGGAPVQFTAQDAESMSVDVQNFVDYRPNAQRVADMPSRIPFDERLVHCAVANHIVRLYRERNAPVVALWQLMNDVLDAMEQELDMVFGPGGCLRTVRHGILLPNGMILRYPGLRQDEDGFSYMGGRGGKERVRTYGGAITENVVQALARIVVADQMLGVATEYGYHVVTMTHDEMVLLVDAGHGDTALCRTLRAMRVPPPWAAGLPLNAEGGFGKSYGDAK